MEALNDKLSMKTVAQLRKYAKDYRIKNYYNMRKNELLASILQAIKKNYEKSLPILDSKVSDIKTPVINPTAYVPKIKPPSLTSVLKSEISNASQRSKALKRAYKPTFETITEEPPEKSKIQKRVEKLYKKYHMEVSGSALKGFTTVHTIQGWSGTDLKLFLESVRPNVMSFLSRHPNIKVFFTATCTMEKVLTDAPGDAINVPFNSKTEINLKSTDRLALYQSACEKMLESMSAFQERGSNWRFKEVKKLEINTAEFVPLSGKSYIPLPDVLAKKKAIINMQNEDDQCFKWCVTRALNPVKDHAERITKLLKEQSEKLCWKDIKFPVNLRDIDKFERNNPTVSINVYGVEDNKKEIYPLRIAENQTCSGRVIDLLLISEVRTINTITKDYETTQHYCLIKNMSRLLTSQVSNKKVKRVFCRRCLSSFDNEKSLAKHDEYCANHEAVRPKLTKPGEKLKFKNYNHSLRVPYVIYAIGSSTF